MMLHQIESDKAPHSSPLMKITPFSLTGMSRAVLSLGLIAACDIAAAGEPLNLFQRLGEAISRAANRPPPGVGHRYYGPPPPPPGMEYRDYGPPLPPGMEYCDYGSQRPPSVDYRTFEPPGTAPRRYQSSYQDSRPMQRIRPPGPQRYGEAGRYDRPAPTRFDEPNARSSLRFQPGIVQTPTQYLVEPVVRPETSPPGASTSDSSLESIRRTLPLDPPALVPTPNLTPPSTVQPTVTVPTSPSTPQVNATPVPRPVIPFANSVSYGRAKMPFPPYTEVDVQGLASGSLAKDPTSGKTFRVP